MTLYEARYSTVYHLLRQENVDRILDFGCGDGKFLHYLAQEAFFTRLGGVDTSSSRLARAKRRVGNDPRVQFYLQSFLEDNMDFHSYTAIIAMEVIEHLEAGELHQLFQNIFHIISPHLIIMTSPNRDYNSHYPILYNGLRHPSHKFEFTVEEFENFGKKLTSSVGAYTFTTGFCDGEHASQFMLWKKVL